MLRKLSYTRWRSLCGSGNDEHHQSHGPIHSTGCSFISCALCVAGADASVHAYNCTGGGGNKETGVSQGVTSVARPDRYLLLRRVLYENSRRITHVAVCAAEYLASLQAHPKACERSWFGCKTSGEGAGI